MAANASKLPRGAGSGHRNGPADHTDRAMTPVANTSETGANFHRGVTDARKSSSCADVKPGVFGDDFCKSG